MIIFEVRMVGHWSYCSWILRKEFMRRMFTLTMALMRRPDVFSGWLLGMPALSLLILLLFHMERGDIRTDES
jgi:hypothetical protein